MWRPVVAAVVFFGSAGAWADMYQDASNAKLPEAQERLGVGASLASFGGKCDGATDDAAAFAAATAWLAGASYRRVSLPAGVCLTSQTVTVGDGRQSSTSLTATAAGTTLSVADCAGVEAGDDVTVVRNDNSNYRGVVASCAAGNMAISPAYTGGAAASGNLVYTGRVSSHQGGGYVGQGSAGDQNGADPVTEIKYIGAAAPTTTSVGVTAALSRTLVVASNTGIVLGTPLMAVLDNGDTFWTTVAKTPATTTLDLENEVPAGRNIPNATSLLIANNPVVRLAGPINGAVFTGVSIDANNLAAIGLEQVGLVQGRGTGAPGGVTVKRHTGVGGFFWARHALIGVYGGSVNGEYEFSTYQPQNNRTIGLWLFSPAARDMAYSRNRFVGGTIYMGGHDAAAAAIREEHADNQVFIKTYTSTSEAYFTPGNLGAGLYRQPSVGVAGLGSENVFVGPALKGGVVTGVATGGTLGQNAYWGYALGDGEPLPTSTVDYGSDTAGNLFGLKKVTVSAGASGSSGLGYYGYASGTYIYGIGRNVLNGMQLDANSAISFSTGSAGVPWSGGLALVIDDKRHLRASGTAPAVTACGTSPSIVGSDIAGTVTLGTGGPANCTITFANAYAATPICVVNWRATPLASQSYTTSTAALTLTQTPTSSNKVDYTCFAQSGG